MPASIELISGVAASMKATWPAIKHRELRVNYNMWIGLTISTNDVQTRLNEYLLGWNAVNDKDPAAAAAAAAAAQADAASAAAGSASAAAARVITSEQRQAAEKELSEYIQAADRHLTEALRVVTARVAETAVTVDSAPERFSKAALSARGEEDAAVMNAMSAWSERCTAAKAAATAVAKAWQAKEQEQASSENGALSESDAEQQRAATTDLCKEAKMKTSQLHHVRGASLKAIQADKAKGMSLRPFFVSRDWCALGRRELLQMLEFSLTDSMREPYSQQSPLNADVAKFHSSSLVVWLMSVLYTGEKLEGDAWQHVQREFLRSFTLSAQFMLSDVGMCMRTQPLLATRTLTQVSGQRFHVIISPGQEAKVKAMLLELAVMKNAEWYIEHEQADSVTYLNPAHVYGDDDATRALLNVDTLADVATLLQWADVSSFSRSRTHPLQVHDSAETDTATVCLLAVGVDVVHFAADRVGDSLHCAGAAAA